MPLTRIFLKLLPPFLFIYVFSNLILGYWDIRWSDLHFYSDQMARVHYLRTLLAHFVLGIAMAILLSAAFTLYASRLNKIDYRSIFLLQIPLSICLILFLIIGIKIHLVWLDSHLFDPDGLLWTLVALASVALLFWVLYSLFRFLYRIVKPHYLLGFLILLFALTLADAWKAISPPPGASGPKKPNVLLIVIDTLRWDHVSAYKNNPITAPNIDRLARESIQYENAISQSPWTTPSHAALFTGQYPSKNGVDGTNIHLHPDNFTMAEVLGKNGYQTAGFINNVYIRKQTGLAQGFQEYEEFWGRNEGSSLLLLLELIKEKRHPRSDKGALITNQAVRNWLDNDWNAENPFFLFTHFMEPHAPYGSTQKHLKEYLPVGISESQAFQVNQDPELYICNKIEMSELDFSLLTALYNSDIRYLDEEIGKLLDLLRKRGLMDETIIVLTADHGENFGEHQLMSHELSVYDTLVKVPLLIRYPKFFAPGSKWEMPVQLIDIFPSLLHILKLGDKNLKLQGSILLQDQPSNPRFVFAEYNNSRAVDNIRRRFGKDLAPNPLYQPKILKAVRSNDWKFIWGTDGSRELYEISNDPFESKNVFQSRPDEAARMEAALKNWISSFTPSRYYQQEDISKEALRELRSLGYVQ